jgi:hypothetical protein
MAGNVSLNTVTDGLVMYLDAANNKSLVDVPSRNLLLWGQQFDNWSKYQSTVSTDTTTAPDGTSTADTNIETSGLTGWRGVSQQLNGVTSGGTYTFSIYAKNYNGRNIQMTVYDVPLYANFYVANFNLQLGAIISSYDTGNGVLTNSSIVSVGNGWYRCSISGYIPNATRVQPYVMLVNSGNTTSYTGDGVSGVYLWGAQLEVGPVATTYIPTTTISASRVPTWVDISKGGNNGTLVNNLTYDYSNGGSLVFNGTSNYINCGDILNYSNNFSVSCWIKINSAAVQPIISKWSSPQVLSRFFLFRIISNTLQFYDSNSTLYVGGTVVSLVWTQVSFVINGSSSQLYINGMASGAMFNPTLTIKTGLNLGIACYSVSLDNFLLGNIPQVSIYNRALSSSEVLQNYNAAKGRFGL